MKKVKIIATGGTIDEVHDVKTEALGFDPDGTTHITDMLRIGHCHFPVVEFLMLKDSLDFDDADRAAIATAVTRAEEDAIVITRGTGTMGETARFLVGRGPEKNRGVDRRNAAVFAQFLRRRVQSRGGVVAAQLPAEGLWGVMNGRVFSADQLHKDTDAGRFDL